MATVKPVVIGSNGLIQESQIGDTIGFASMPTLARGSFITSDDGVNVIERSIAGIGSNRAIGIYPAVGGNILYPMTLSDLIIPPREMWHYDDMLPPWAATTSGTGAGISFATQPIVNDRRHGVVTLTTGTTTTGRCTYSNGLTNYIYGNNGPLVFDRIFYIPTLSTAAQEYTLELGLGDNTGGTDYSTNQIQFVYKRTVSINWLAITTNGGSPNRTITDTGVPVTTGWHWARIIPDPSLNACYFYMDTVGLGGITTNIPTPTTAIMGDMIKIRKTVGTTPATVSQDSVLQRHYRTNSLSYGA